MVNREIQKIDPAEVMRVASEASATFAAALTSDERAASEKLSANDGDQGLVYSTLERDQALDDFDVLAAADSLQILGDQIHATIQRRAQELYQKCLQAYYVAEDMARDPEHAELVPHVENMRRAHLAQYGKPIPPKKG
ncbi:MAG: hypothetical protein ACXW31_11345 [Thermoanaerobaculia bacterium]